MNGYKVNNLPAYAKDYSFIVARFVDGELWFWGAFADEERACAVADEIGGIAIENK